MLRLRVLPRIPSRITIADPELWKDTEDSFRKGRATEADVHHAACFLLLDIWLWVTECYAQPKDSRFRGLVELTRGHSAPELRVAHCLRDIAHGSKSREADLGAMLESADPATRRMFVEACWVDDDKTARSKARRSRKQ